MQYDDWNQALANYFFNETQVGKPVYLHVDDQLIEEIAIQNGIAADRALTDFKAALRKRYRPRDNVAQPFFHVFRWTMWEFNRKQNCYEPPPFIALLCACVVAASRMANTDDVTSGNYYDHLNELLDRKGRGAPNGFNQFVQLWERLNKWLNDDLQGQLGKATAHNKLNYGTHIDWPISQTLIRRTDREKLPLFFKRTCDLAPHEEGVDVEFFVSQLRYYDGYLFSKQMQRMLNAQREDQLYEIAEVALTEYEQWDGSLTEEGGGRSKEIMLQVVPSRRSFDIFLHPPAPRDFPTGNYGSVNLQLFDTSWFDPLPESFTIRYLLGENIKLTQDKFSLTLPYRSVIPLHQNNESGLSDWLATDRFSLGEKHLILCHRSEAMAVENYLQRAAADGWRKVNGVRNAAEWCCYRNVRIERLIIVEDEALQALLPVQRNTLRLVGGLKLKAGVWLSGGEPELLISAESPTPILLNEQQISVAQVGSSQLDLLSLQLTEGSHTIQCGKQTRKLAIANSGSGVTGSHTAQRWGYPIVRQGDNFRPKSLQPQPVPNAKAIASGTLYLAGVHIVQSANDPPPPRKQWLTLPYGAQRYFILGRASNEYVEPTLPTTIPKWKAAKRGLLQGYVVTVPFKPQWIISISQSNNITLRPVSIPDDPLPLQDDNNDIEWLRWTGDKQLWRRMNSTQRKRLKSKWLQYVRLARGET